MRVAMGADHGGFDTKTQLAAMLAQGGHEVIDFGNKVLDAVDDYPDLAIPLARTGRRGAGRPRRSDLWKRRGRFGCGGIRAALVHDNYSTRQGVEDDNMNVLCLGRRTAGVAVAWDCVQNFLSANSAVPSGIAAGWQRSRKWKAPCPSGGVEGGSKPRRSK